LYYPVARPVLNERPQRAGPLRVLWNHRWEYDKNPELFFRVIDTLKGGSAEGRSRLTPVRILVLGQQFAEEPPVFAAARERLAGWIEHWGYISDAAQYHAIVASADVVVSTADVRLL
jgi:glycosyltransferase involved in cell wall biosynthesis